MGWALNPNVIFLWEEAHEHECIGQRAVSVSLVPPKVTKHPGTGRKAWDSCSLTTNSMKHSGSTLMLVMEPPEPRSKFYSARHLGCGPFYSQLWEAHTENRTCDLPPQGCHLTTQVFCLQSHKRTGRDFAPHKTSQF